MSIAIALAMLVVVIAVVAWPLLRRSRSHEVRGEAEDAEKLRRARTEVYREIQLLDTERDAGLIEGDDYGVERRDLRIAAARLMQAEAKSRSDPSAEELEREVWAARQRRARGDPEKS